MNCHESIEIWSYIIGIATVATSTYLLYRLGVNSRLLRDDVAEKKPLDQVPYSLSRVQLAWWTFIVFTAFVIVMVKCNWTIHSDVQVFSETALLLLGVGIGTTAVGRGIDNADKRKNPTSRHQEELETGTAQLLSDVSSDQNGLSIHRVQQVLFSIAFGVIFLKETIFESGMPEFDAKWLSIIGISAAGYAGGKLTENKVLNKETVSLLDRYKRLLALPEPLLLSKFDSQGEAGEDLLKHIFESLSLNESDADMLERLNQMSADEKKLIQGNELITEEPIK